MNEHYNAWFDTAPVLDFIYSPGILYFAATLALVFLGRLVKSRTARYDLDEQLTKVDNKAVAVSVAGYFFALMLVAKGVLISGGNSADTLWQDIGSVAIWTLISMALLFISAWINRKFLLSRFDTHKELIQDRNVGTGSVIAGAYIGTALIVSASISGTTGGGFGLEVLDTLIYFVIGQVAFVLFGALYQRFCGYDLHAEIEKDNEGAGIAFSMTLVGVAILIAGQIRRSDSLPALALWIPVAILILLGCRWLVDLVILHNARIHDEIARDKNWGVALIEGACAIGIALLLDASFN